MPAQFDLFGSAQITRTKRHADPTRQPMLFAAPRTLPPGPVVPTKPQADGDGLDGLRTAPAAPPSLPLEA